MLRHLLRDQRANVAVIFALVALPLLSMVGGAADYANAIRLRHSTAAAADAAALAAVKAATDHIKRNGATAQSVVEAEALGRRAAEAFFAGNQPTARSLEALTPAITLQANRQSVTATVSVTGAVSTSILSIVGVGTLPIGVTARSTQTPQKFVQIAFALDVSQSMGIGGTPADITRLERHRQINCAFACHDPQGIHGANTRAIARRDGIDLKIDYLQRAVVAFVERIERLQNHDSYQLAMTTFGSTHQQLLARTNDLRRFRQEAERIDMEIARSQRVNGVWAYGWTDVATALGAFNRSINSVGDGSSPSALLSYVILVTDGLQDLPAPGFPYERNTNTQYGAECRALRRNGEVEVYVIHAPTPAMNHHAYRVLVAPHQAAITRTLQDCATSPRHFFLATDGPGIRSAIEQIANEIASTPRLTH